MCTISTASSVILVENFVEVSNEWDDKNAWAFNDQLCALWPSRDSCDHDAQPSFDGCRGARIICCAIRSDAAKIVYYGTGKDNLHARRNLPKAAFTYSSVASHPCRASSSPRSIPASSSSVA